MPNRDHTGPNGQGPRTGRAMGRCRAGASAAEVTSNDGWGGTLGRGRGRGWGQCRSNGQGRANGQGRGNRWGFGGWLSNSVEMRAEPQREVALTQAGSERDAQQQGKP